MVYRGIEDVDQLRLGLYDRERFADETDTCTQARTQANSWGVAHLDFFWISDKNCGFKESLVIF